MNSKTHIALNSNTGFINRMWKAMHKLNQRDRAWIELDVGNLLQNLSGLKSMLPACELMPVIKANAYGHGVISIAKLLQRHGIRYFCVATAEEGVELRKSGIKGTILILGYSHPDIFPLLRRYQLTQTVIDLAYARQLESFSHKLHVHVKIDTGMHRLGFSSDSIKEVLQVWDMDNLVVDGIFTHLCCDETRNAADKLYTKHQLNRFHQVLDVLNDHHLSYGKTHILASYGILNNPELGGNLARPGIALYGVLSSRESLYSCPITLRPVLSLKARIALIREVYSGESVGYGHSYVANTDCRIAVLSIGYADGIPRTLSNGNGKVLINGQSCPVIGNICMDQMMVDITGVSGVKAGDAVILIGKSGNLEITAYDLAEASGTITNEILSRLGSRLPRIIVNSTPSFQKKHCNSLESI